MAVEFALVLPLVVMLLLGTVTAGLSYAHSIGLTNAVREGSRFGATMPMTNINDWTTGTLSRVRETQFDDDPVSPKTTVCVRLYKVGTGEIAGSLRCDPTLSSPFSNPTGFEAGKCVVQVWASRPYKIVLGIFPSWEETMTRVSTARYERDC